jgi:C terminal of Calcineurin-like phosphoesterase/Calcineurin-like phosphoesterase
MALKHIRTAYIPLHAILVFACCLTASTAAQDQPGQLQTARGTVFVDDNANGRRDEGERALAGVRISNGRETVATGADGGYEIGLDEDDILFVIKPAGYRTRLSKENLPLFYYIHKPAGSPQLRYPGVPPTGPLPERIDFPLYVQEEPEKFQAILFGDTQSRDRQELDYMKRTSVRELAGSSAAFGVTLGDILFDDLSLFSEHNQIVGTIGIPWYNVIGNHDTNQDSRERRFSTETYQSYYGPSWYSFDYGPVHFVALDNINWYWDNVENKGTYDGTFGADQLGFLKSDLSQVPNDRLVVLFMHIPLHNCTDAGELYKLIESRPFAFSVSAHQHYHRHHFLGAAEGWKGTQPHHHMVNVTVCGAWWTGLRNAGGIPHGTMTDGSPPGYSIVTFEKDRYVVDFKAAGLPDDYQMNILIDDRLTVSETATSEVLVNVFNGSEKSITEMRVDGSAEWQRMEQVFGPDPRYVEQRNFELTVTPQPAHKMGEPAESGHLWKGKPGLLSAGVHMIEVRSTDMHGRAYTSKRIITVAEDAAPAADSTSVR